MSGLNLKRLVFLEYLSADAQEAAERSVGTGYLITQDIILTAAHVLGRGPDAQIKARLEEGAPLWREVDPQPLWHDPVLDATLLRMQPPVDLEGDVEFISEEFSENQQWSSTAYPAAASQLAGELREYKTLGLGGTLYGGGGRGQGLPDLDLAVDAYVDHNGWGGISGAPVFVGDKIAGVIKSSLLKFAERRLAAVPAWLLLKEPLFRLAIEPQPFRLPSGPLPILVLHRDTLNEQLLAIVRAATKLEVPEEAPLFGPIASIRFQESLSSPERFLGLVQAICQAPVLVMDVTDFTPGALLALGIRAVVRRGVTVLLTAKPVDETVLSQHPFNIQETKLISFLDKLDIKHPLHPIRRIKSAISNGIRQVLHDARYLDLPAYDFVRCSAPQPENNILVLCSFHKEYSAHWDYISSQLFLKAADTPPVRLIDLPSPRLVGQALYEAIRHTPWCIVDWTHWRPNVFFELGVRLACSEVSPICLIEQNEAAELLVQEPEHALAAEGAEAKAPLPYDDLMQQKLMLLKLLKPIVYRVDDDQGLALNEVIARYRSGLRGLAQVQVDRSSLNPNDVYTIVSQSYDWSHDPTLLRPHTELGRLAEQMLGPDPEKIPTFLFSSNGEYAKEVRKSAAEKWVAAALYLRGRYSIGEIRSSAALYQEALEVANIVGLVLKDFDDEIYRKIRAETKHWIDEVGSKLGD